MVGWKNTSPIIINDNNPPENRFSIIIPFRNEEKNLGACLESISALEYPKDLFNVILVDDHSTDFSNQIAIPYLNDKIKLISNTSHGKKQAISQAISLADKENIITLDADCIVPIQWLNGFDAILKNTNALMVIGPVAISSDSTCITSFQSLEMMANMAINAYGILRKKYFIGNGANLCFSKSAFHHVAGYSGNEHIASGDDVFLISKFAATFPNKIKFLKCLEATVFTAAVTSLSDLLSQRRRWSAKTKAYASFSIITIQGFVFLTNLMLLFYFFYATIFHWIHIPFSVFFIVVKMGIDYYFLNSLSHSFSIKITRFFCSFISYSAYIFYMAYVAVFQNKYTWKGRKTT